MDPEQNLIEELDVAPARVAGGPSRRALLVVAGLAAIVGYGFVSGAGDEPARDSDRDAAQQQAAPAPSTFPSTDLGPIIDQPAEAATIRGAIVPVSGRVPVGVDRLRILVLAGREVVAEQIVRPAGERFDVSLQVAVPGEGRPVPVTIAVRDATDAEGRDLARRTIAIVQANRIAVVDARVERADAGGTLVVVGRAAEGIEEIVVEAAGATADAAPDGGAWTAVIALADAAGPIPVTVRWTDTSGARGTTWLTIAGTGARTGP